MDSIENNALKNDLEAKENQIGELEKRLNEFETKFSSDEKILQELTIKVGGKVIVFCLIFSHLFHSLLIQFIFCPFRFRIF